MGVVVLLALVSWLRSSGSAPCPPQTHRLPENYYSDLNSSYPPTLVWTSRALYHLGRWHCIIFKLSTKLPGFEYWAMPRNYLTQVIQRLYDLFPRNGVVTIVLLIELRRQINLDIKLHKAVLCIAHVLKSSAIILRAVCRLGRH